MFSMIPKIGTFTFWNIASPLRESCSATSCGVVKIAPDYVPQELLDGGVDHRSTPRQRLVIWNEEPHRDQLDAVTLRRQQLAVPLLGRTLHAHHHRDVGAVHVGIHEPDLRALKGQTGGQIDRDRRFADASLAAADGDGVLDGWDEVVFDLGATLLYVGGEIHFDFCHTGDRAHRFVATGFDLGLERAGWGGQHHGELDGPLLDLQVLDHVEGDEVLVQLRLHHHAECVDDCLFRYLRHVV